MSLRFSALLLAAAASFGTIAVAPAFAVVPNSASTVDTDASGLALQGYDPVAYFVDGQPEKGKADLKIDHGGATYYFASAKNMEAFKANPDAYLPQYGGFCAMGASFNHKFEGDPKVWRIVDNKLYVNFNPDVGHRWAQDIPANISRANDNWPQIKDKTPDQLQ